MTTRHAKAEPPAPITTNITARVYYEDTDAGGIVYHANFLKFAERGRTEMLRTLGFDHHGVMKDHRIIFVVRHIEIDYKAPGKLDDLLNIATSVESIGNSSMIMRQIIERSHGDRKILAEMKVTVVAINPEGRAVRIPPQLRQIFGDH